MWQCRTTTRPCAPQAPSRRRIRSSRSRRSPACATAATTSARSARRAGTASCRACSADSARVRALIRRLFAGTEPQAPEPALWDGVRRRARWVGALDADRDARLQALAARFLRDKTITPIGNLELDAAERTLLA